MEDYRPSMDAWQKITDSLWYTHLYLRTFIPLLDANARKSIRDNSQWSWDSPQGCGPSGFALSQNYSSGILVNLGIYFLIPLGFEKKRKERERKAKEKRNERCKPQPSPSNFLRAPDTDAWHSNPFKHFCWPLCFMWNGRNAKLAPRHPFSMLIKVRSTSGSQVDFINCYTLVSPLLCRGWRHPGTSGLRLMGYPRRLLDYPRGQ